jgi:lactate permease
VAGAPFAVAAVGLVILRWPAVWAGACDARGGRLRGGGVAGAGYRWGSGGLARGLRNLGAGAVRLVRRVAPVQPALGGRGGGAGLAVSGEVGAGSRGARGGVVVGVAPFFESVTGFGVAVVISAPILLAAGFSPLKAAVLASGGSALCRGGRSGWGP